MHTLSASFACSPYVMTNTHSNTFRSKAQLVSQVTEAKKAAEDESQER